MKSAISAEAYYPRRLVDVEESAAEIEHRAEHEVCQGVSNSLAVVALGAQEHEQHVAGDHDDDHEGCE
jgi:hypothetical protein